MVLVLGAAALFVGLLVFGLLAQAPRSSIDDSLARGRPAQAQPFTLAVLERGQLGATLERKLAGALADGRVSLRELRGLPIVLNVWASWCDPCRQEAPLLERTWRSAGRPTGTLFVGLDQQDITTDAHTFVRSYGIDYLNVRDPATTCLAPTGQPGYLRRTSSAPAARSSITSSGSSPPETFATDSQPRAAAVR